jgi:hypothetical protein
MQSPNLSGTVASHRISTGEQQPPVFHPQQEHLHPACQSSIKLWLLASTSYNGVSDEKSLFRRHGHTPVEIGQKSTFEGVKVAKLWWRRQEARPSVFTGTRKHTHRKEVA